VRGLSPRLAARYAGRMKRTLSVLAALLLAACPQVEEPRFDCQPEAFDLSACNRSSLQAVGAEGIWNLQLTLGGGVSLHALRLGAASTLLGLPVSERRTEGDSFYVAADARAQDGSPLRYTLVGCEASAPGRLRGQFRLCVNGRRAADLEGTFEAARLGWREGEPQASGLQLVAERALTLERGGAAVDVFVSGGYAYVSALADGLAIYDVRNPEAPQRVAVRLPSEGDSWMQARLKGAVLMVASVRRGIILFDVSDPSAPRQLRTLPETAVEVQSLLVDGDRLFAVSPSPRGDVLLYDLSRPDQPVLQSRFVVADSDPTLGELPMDVAVLGNRLYISHWSYGLAVAEVTDLRKPTLLGAYRYPKAASRSVAVGSFGNRTLAFELSESWDGRVRVLDVSAPEGIGQIGEFRLRSEVAPHSMALSGSRLYTAWNQEGLRVLDVSVPSEPRQVAHYNTWRDSDPRRGLSFYEGLSGLHVPGDGFIYAAETSRGLLIFREQQ
jgi:hypothetical protein